MSISVRKIKPYVLPAAIALGLLLHTLSAMLTWMVPWLVFTILFITYTAVDLRQLRFNRLDLNIMVFQVVVSLAAYLIFKYLFRSEDLAQGAMICVLCPVASSVVVVSSALGADRRTTTGYTIFGNLLVAVAAPVYFSFIGVRQDMPFFDSCWLIFCKIAPVIALPFFLALALQRCAPRLNGAIASIKGWTFPMWAAALFITLGTTIDYIFLYHKGHELTILWLGVIAVGACIVQFAVGRRLGACRGEKVAGGQLMGQKNTGIGIWMASVYLNPLAAVALAFYAIAQNLFNSWQMWTYEKHRNRHIIN